MKKHFLKRALCATLACATIAGSVVGLTACNGGGNNQKVSITIGVQQAEGSNFQSMCNFLDSLKEELNFEYSTSLLRAGSDAANLVTLENAALSGADGIINMCDMSAAGTKALLDKCAQTETYYAGYMTDFTQTFNNTKADDQANVNAIKSSKYMLGAVTDGGDGQSRGKFLFDEAVKNNHRKVTFARSPLDAYPIAAVAINEFKRLATEYNENHDDKFEFIANANGSDTLEVGFYGPSGTVSDATVQGWKASGVEAVIAVNSLGKKLLTPINTANANIAIYQVGCDNDIKGDFPTKIKTLCQTPAETIIYPLIRIINAVRGESYSDEPTDKAKTVITGDYSYLTTSADLTSAVQYSMNFSEDHSVSRAIISKEDVKALLASEGGTFKKLSDTIASWDTKYALYRQK